MSELCLPLKRCTRCLMPQTRPDTEFANGVCSACIAYDQRKDIDWTSREQHLLRILESAKPNGSGYDCVVPSSGGKDSHWQVLKLIELGARPLVVTASTCMLTPIGRANIDNLARYATTIEVTPNRRVRAMLNRLGLELVGDISWPEHVSIFATPWRIARDLGIPLLFYGECPQNAYGGPMDTLDALKMNRRWIAEFGGHLGMRASDMIGMYGITADHMADYQMPTPEVMADIDAYFLGAFLEWNSHRNARHAVNAGMRTELPSGSNWWVHENLDNAQTGLHDFFGALKFSYGRLCAQISVDIRYGMLTREEAVPIAKERDCRFPATYMDVHYWDVLNHIGMARNKFMETCNKHANPYFWVSQEGELPQLRRDVWEASFA